MDLVFIFYIFLSIVIISGSTFYYAQSNQTITAGLVFFGFIAAAVVFGLRWFTSSGQTVGVATGGWPPVLNYCPDFLSLYEVDGTKVCIDTIGVSRDQTLKRWTSTDQTSEPYLFPLFLDKTGDDRAKALCEKCVEKKVTWEGVHDGSLCIGNNPPMPPRAA
jgi:hypothetical protein